MLSMKRRLMLPLLIIGAIVGLAPGAAGAQRYGPHWTVATAECTPSLVEGQIYAERCPITVEDGSASMDPSSIPTPPTGTVAVNGTTVCTLVPSGPNASACDYTTTVVWGTTFSLEIVYSGDETHQGTLSYFLKWAPGYPDYPPEIPARAPLPGEFPVARPVSPQGGASEPRIVTWPQKRTREHLATFSFTGGGRYECALDQGRFRPSGASFSRRVSTGPHVLRLRRENGGTAVVYNWRVLPRRG
jgi:hypothetical protein